MERRPLRNQPFATLWKVLFLVVMELGIRNDLVDPDPDPAALQEENEEEEEELAEDPEIHPDDFTNWEIYTNGGSGSDDQGSPPGEPEAELNPAKEAASSVPDDPPGDDQVGSSKTGEKGMVGLNYVESAAQPWDEDAPSTPFGPPDEDQQGDKQDEVQISMHGSAPGDFVMACEEEKDSGFLPYNPFDRPPGEIIVQVFPRSRSRSARRPCPA